MYILGAAMGAGGAGAGTGALQQAQCLIANQNQIILHHIYFIYLHYDTIMFYTPPPWTSLTPQLAQSVYQCMLYVF